MGFVVILLRGNWGKIYSNQKEIINYVGIMMPIVAISSFLDGIQSVLSGLFPYIYAKHFDFVIYPNG